MSLQLFKMQAIWLFSSSIRGIGFSILGICLLGVGSRPGLTIQFEPVDFDASNSPGLSSEQVADGWLCLFDGQSLFGWRRETDSNWQVENDVLRVNAGGVGLLRSAVQFDDFELCLEFKADPETNSGIFIRSSPRPMDPTRDCFEINIAPDSNPFPTGSIVGLAKGKKASRLDGWNHMRIQALQNSIQVWVNNALTVDYQTTEPFLTKGYIGLQHNQGEVRFRNVVVKPMAVPPIFNGKDLSGWDSRNRLESRFEIADDSTLQMLNGKGQLETNAKYGDFVFSTHVRTNANGLNSGIFFRCIPGELMNGYESQIQNQFEDNDVTKPVDCGTGGIFRRQDARIVNARDKQWLAKTIIADGATICVWVNGLQVADWTDNRKPNANPRKGLRLQPGSLILQGHDPTTDVSFRNMRARELHSRKKQ